MIESEKYLDHEKLGELYLFQDAEDWLLKKIALCSPKEPKKCIALKMALANCMLDQNKNRKTKEILEEIKFQNHILEKD